ncbi:MAG: nitroreductase [Deltaproteobacteria bacterium]|nr:nitroreductase [Deltaproteobacteria bacterium]
MNETIRTLRSLRTIHGDFTKRRISGADLQTVLDCAVRAANASGRQSYSIVTVSDRDKMRHLCGYAGDRLLVFCVDFTRIIDLARHLGHEFTVPDIAGFVTGSTDTILAAQTACIAARSLGIDSLFTNGIHRGSIERVFSALELPDRHCFPLVALVLGYAGQEPPHQKGRLTGPGIVHRETYRRLTTKEREALVAQYDDPACHLALNEDWAKEGVRHYLDWFYTRWSRHRDTRPLWQALQKAGFVPGGESGAK